MNLYHELGKSSLSMVVRTQNSLCSIMPKINRAISIL